MFKIRTRTGVGLIGEWNDLPSAESFALNYSNNHVGTWEVTKDGRTVSAFSNGNKQTIKLSVQEQERELATAIHGKLCRYNHEDQCDWFYGDRWTEEFSAKHEYLKKARAMLDNGVEFDQAMKVISHF